MKNSLKLRAQKITKVVFLALLIFFVACEEKKEPVEYVVKVNESVLSRTELNKKLSSERYDNRYTEEFIRNWIENEILFQEARSEDILEDTLFTELINESRKELAAAVLLKKYFAEKNIDVDAEEINEYYKSHNEELKSNSDIYIYNLVRFNDESKAIQFRNTLIETGWNKTLNVFSNDKSIIYSKENILKKEYELNPPVLAKVLIHLNQFETSIIFETEPEVFNIVQLADLIKKNEIPELKYVREIVEERIILLKRKELYKDLMEDLYSKYNVVINRYAK